MQGFTQTTRVFLTIHRLGGRGDRRLVIGSLGGLPKRLKQGPLAGQQWCLGVSRQTVQGSPEP